jgi:hypothetical protein
MFLCKTFVDKLHIYIKHLLMNVETFKDFP